MNRDIKLDMPRLLKFCEESSERIKQWQQWERDAVRQISNCFEVNMSHYKDGTSCECCQVETSGRHADALLCAALAENEELKKERDMLKAECTQMSEEFGLPPTMRPAEGEIKRMMQERTELRAENEELRQGFASVRGKKNFLVTKVEELKAKLAIATETLERITSASTDWTKIDGGKSGLQSLAETALDKIEETK